MKKESIRNICFALGCLMIIGGCCLFPKEGPKEVPVFGEGDRISVDIKILYDREIYTPWTVWIPWRGKAELYLKVYDKAVPDAFFLYPLNVAGIDSGSRTRQLLLPFTHSDTGNTVLVFEILDDDGLSKRDEANIIEAATSGSRLLYTSGMLLAINSCNVSMTLPNGCKVQAGGNLSPENFAKLVDFIRENRKDAAKLGEACARIIVDNFNQHKFTSYGYREYKLYHKSGVFTGNPSTVVSYDGKALVDLTLITTK